MRPTRTRRLLLLLASPFLLALALISISVGVASLGGIDNVLTQVSALEGQPPEIVAVAGILIRCVFLPFQLIFTLLLFSLAVWIYRHRSAIAEWLLGYPVLDRLSDYNQQASGDQAAATDPLHIRPGRRRTIHQVVASVIAAVALTAAFVLSLGQFVPLSELAVVVTALTSGLAWGARLIIGDLLGGIGNIFENNYAVGDDIMLKLIDKHEVEGDVERVNLRYASLRSPTGELVTVPNGDVRVFRNFSRSTRAGVYVPLPVSAPDVTEALIALEEMSPRSPELVPGLLEPWHVVCNDGRLGTTVALAVYGRTLPGQEDELQLAVHEVIRKRFVELGIDFAGQGSA